MLRSVNWYLVVNRRFGETYTFLQGPVFLDCLTFEDGTGVSSRNVGSYQSGLRNISEERRKLEFKISKVVVNLYCDN